MIEAMAASTLVTALPGRSAPEVIDHGVSGLLVDSVDEAVAAVPLAAAMSRAGVRAAFEARFTIGRVVDEYLQVYRSLCGTGLSPREALPLSA